MLTYCVDIDETLCHSTEDDYAHSVPNREAIAKVNKLYDDGNRIKLYTGRGSGDDYDWRAFTEQQLVKWGVKYHELLFNKPHADIFIDDKALNTRDWLTPIDTSSISEVERSWGRELWITNCEEYCGKLLEIPKGAFSEYHYHKKKKETFYCLQGQVTLVVEGREVVLDPLLGAVTIRPGERHAFKGNSNSLLLEVSTHHSDEDSILLSEGYRP